MSPIKVCLVRGALVSPRGSVNNEPTPPLGLAYLAGSLVAAGFTVRGIDATGLAVDRVEPITGTELQASGLPIDEVVERIEPGTAVIGVSCMFSHEWTHQRALIQAIRERHPHCFIVAGGEHCTALPEYTLRDCPAIDFVALGEGEETITEFCQAVAGGRDPAQVPGLAYRNGSCRTSPPRARLVEVDRIPRPDWDVFPIEPYLASNISFGASFGRNMPVLASRGCPYQCTFCSNPAMWTTRYTIRTPRAVLDEIEHYRDRYAIRGVQFYDLTAIVRKEWIVDFCRQAVERGLDLDWSLPSGTRSEALDDEALGWLMRARCRYLVYAPESGSARTLKRIKKKINLERMKGSIQSAIRQGIVVRTNLILGFPHESRRDMWATLRLVLWFAWIGVDEAPLYPFQPYPGSELFRSLLASGRIRLDDPYFDRLATFSTGKLSPPRDSFCDRVGRLEVYLYRIAGMLAFFVLAYLLYPRRIGRTIYNLAFSDRSATVVEQRLRDKLRHIRASLALALRRRPVAPAAATDRDGRAAA